MWESNPRPKSPKSNTLNTRPRPRPCKLCNRIKMFVIAINEAVFLTSGCQALPRAWTTRSSTGRLKHIRSYIRLVSNHTTRLCVGNQQTNAATYHINNLLFNPLRLQYVILRTKSKNRCDYCTYIYIHGLCDRNMGLLPASKRHFTADLPTPTGYPWVSRVFTLLTVPRPWQQLLTGLFLPHGFIFTSTLANNYCREHVLAA